MTVDEDGDMPCGRADLIVVEGLSPHGKELPEDELAPGGGLDVDDAVGCVCVKVVEATAGPRGKVSLRGVGNLCLAYEADP
jgi:hypothetical protein